MDSLLPSSSEITASAALATAQCMFSSTLVGAVELMTTRMPVVGVGMTFQFDGFGDCQQHDISRLILESGTVQGLGLSVCKVFEWNIYGAFLEFI